MPVTGERGLARVLVGIHTVSSYTADSLYWMMQKGATWDWTDAAEAAFQGSKRAVAQVQVL